MQATINTNTRDTRDLAHTRPVIVRTDQPCRDESPAGRPVAVDDAIVTWARRAIQANGFGDIGM